MSGRPLEASRPNGIFSALSGEFLQNRIVDGEFLLGVSPARVGVRHQQCDGRALRSIGEIRQKLAAAPDHGFALSGVGIELQQLGVQFRALG